MISRLKKALALLLIPAIAFVDMVSGITQELTFSRYEIQDSVSSPFDSQVLAARLALFSNRLNQHPKVVLVESELAYWAANKETLKLADRDLAKLFDAAFSDPNRTLEAWRYLDCVTSPGPYLIEVVGRHLPAKLPADDLIRAMAKILGNLWRSGSWESNGGPKSFLLPLASIEVTFQDADEARSLTERAFAYLEPDYERQLEALTALGTGLVNHLRSWGLHGGPEFPDVLLLADALRETISRLVAWRRDHPDPLSKEQSHFWNSILDIINTMRDESLLVDPNRRFDLRAAFFNEALQNVPLVVSPEDIPTLQRRSDSPTLSPNTVAAVLDVADRIKVTSGSSVTKTESPAPQRLSTLRKILAMSSLISLSISTFLFGGLWLAGHPQYIASILAIAGFIIIGTFKITGQEGDLDATLLLKRTFGQMQMKLPVGIEQKILREVAAGTVTELDDIVLILENMEWSDTRTRALVHSLETAFLRVMNNSKPRPNASTGPVKAEVSGPYFGRTTEVLLQKVRSGEERSDVFSSDKMSFFPLNENPEAAVRRLRRHEAGDSPGSMAERMRIFLSANGIPLSKIPKAAQMRLHRWKIAGNTILRSESDYTLTQWRIEFGIIPVEVRTGFKKNDLKAEALAQWSEIKTIGEAILVLRRIEGLSPKELATAIGVHLNSVLHWEDGTAEEIHSPKVYTRLAKTLKVDVGRLIEKSYREKIKDTNFSTTLDRINRLRIAVGKTSDELEAEVRGWRGYVSDYDRGLGVPPEFVQRLCAFLNNATPEEIFPTRLPEQKRRNTLDPRAMPGTHLMSALDRLTNRFSQEELRNGISSSAYASRTNTRIRRSIRKDLDVLRDKGFLQMIGKTPQGEVLYAITELGRKAARELGKTSVVSEPAGLQLLEPAGVKHTLITSSLIRTARWWQSVADNYLRYFRPAPVPASKLLSAPAPSTEEDMVPLRTYLGWKLMDDVTLVSPRGFTYVVGAWVCQGPARYKITSVSLEIPAGPRVEILSSGGAVKIELNDPQNILMYEPEPPNKADPTLTFSMAGTGHLFPIIRSLIRDIAQHIPRYTYSLITGSLVYYWTHNIVGLSVAVVVTLLLPLSWSFFRQKADEPKRVLLLRDDKAFRRSLYVLFAGQLLVPVPWALPFLAYEILGIHSPNVGWLIALLGISFWAGNGVGAFVQNHWNIARHRNLAWRTGFFGSGALMIAMAGPVHPWVWTAAMAALGFTMSMGFIVTKAMVHDQPEENKRHADVLYNLFVYGGAAAGILLFGWLATGIGAARAMFINGLMLVIFESLLSLPDFVDPILQKIPVLRKAEIKQWTRKLIIRNPGLMVSTLVGILSRYRTDSWKKGLLYMAMLRLSLLGAHLISKVALPRIGHHEKYRRPENLIYPEPPLDSKRGLSKPGNPRSIEPFVWQGDPGLTLEDGTPVRELDTLVLSDTHLQDIHMQAELLLDFLKHHTFKRLILLGDIVDYQIHRPMTPAQKDVLRYIQQLSQQGADVIYVPGNHDKQWRTNAREGTPVEFRDENGVLLLSLHAVLEYQWELPDGRTAHAVHGDEYDKLSFLQWLGGNIYDHTLDVDNWILRERRILNLASEFYIGKIAKRLGKSYLRTSRRKLAEDAIAHDATVGFAGHTHDGEIRILKVRYPETGEMINVTVVNTDNSQNPLHAGAAGVRPDGRIELYQWKKVLGRGPVSIQAPIPLEIINPEPASQAPPTTRVLKWAA